MVLIPPFLVTLTSFDTIPYEKWVFVPSKDSNHPKESNGSSKRQIPFGATNTNTSSPVRPLQWRVLSGDVSAPHDE